jgi:hypothetical protein
VSLLPQYQNPSSPILPGLPHSSKVQESTAASPLSREQDTRSPISSLPPSGSKVLSSDPPLLNTSQRRSEVGFFSKSSPQPFRLLFERAPVWLLALVPSICSAAYIGEVKNVIDLLELLRSRGEDPTLFNRAVTQLGVTRVHYCGNKLGPHQATTLISDSYPFLQRAANKPGLGHTMFLLDEPWQGKTNPKPLTLLTWQRVKPIQFGGSTNYPVLVGSAGFRLLLKDLPWLATWDTFWTTPFIRFPLLHRKSSHWKSWHKPMSVNLLLTHAIWSGLSRTRPPTPQAIVVAACSRPNKLAFRLVSPGDYIGEDSLRTCSPSY